MCFYHSLQAAKKTTDRPLFPQPFVYMSGTTVCGMIISCLEVIHVLQRAQRQTAALCVCVCV